jgi:hypothetical protein
MTLMQEMTLPTEHVLMVRANRKVFPTHAIKLSGGKQRRACSLQRLVAHPAAA